MLMQRAGHAALLAAVASLAAAGCAIPDYHYGRFADADPPAPAPVVEAGGPNRTLDAAARVVDAPARLLPFGPTRDRDIAPATLDILTTYLARNDLGDVPVYVNCYDPAGQWRRLRANRRVGLWWRYTAGTASVVGYTLFPGRVFGTNRYNPFTNSLSVNSDRPAELLYEAAVAKDVRGRRLPGAYVAVTSLPGGALVRRVRATRDVVGYTRAAGDWATEREAYCTLYPGVGMEGIRAVTTPVVALSWWAGPVFGLCGAGVGRVVGQRTLARREAEVRAAADLASAGAE